MSSSPINVSVTVTIKEGVVTFSYDPVGPYQVTVSTDVVFTLSSTCNPNLLFLEPLISYVPVDAPKDINPSITPDKQTLTLSDTDVDEETIGVQLVVQDSHQNTYASPDPQIINRGRD
ncbi:DP-EP family protein [Paraglaciecola sp. 2405UD69-4]|uniref:DP-EP family protein n=1 Tax=Paraglaciecola sp. 2405UD69-4 TaxID=3391836 RepID=UPI0039C8E03D